jgi:thiamine-monophosphate kinase
MRVSEVGEFGLIRLIQEIAEKYKNPSEPSWRKLLVGIGDDVAAWKENDQILLATTDSLIQGVHFEPGVITWEELGWKALAVNLSDIAAMGGRPRYALVCLSCPGHSNVEDISTLFHSMASLASTFGVAVVGGNVASAPLLDVTVTLLGEASGQAILRRSDARAGDLIAVTGHLGGSAAGLAMLKRGLSLEEGVAGELRRAHFHPVPRVPEGCALVSHGIRTGIDVSDGLVADLEHICESSRVRATIELDKVPIHPLVRQHFPDYTDLALYGGEDYELLFTGTEACVGRAKDALDCPVTTIGVISTAEAPEVRVVDSSGATVSSRRQGWQHFRDETTTAEVT